ncbi:MAG: HAD family phosphatase [Lachnospiraceae bacterium]|nr:HAD family phosphatase [Lachnospiraceae bacterium]
MMRNKKVLFLDMDGTTLDDNKQLSEANLDALCRAVKAGHEVVITTGRTHSSAGYLREHYGLDRIGCRYMIVYNGAAILDCETGKLLYSKTIPIEYAARMIDAAREEGVYLHSYTEKKVLTERDDENLAVYLKRTSMEAEIVPDLKKAVDRPPYKLLAVEVRDPDRLLAFKQNQSSWIKGKVDMYFSCREYLEVVPEGVSKGAALQMFCKMREIPIEHTIAAGDEGNDLSMLRAAGIGCAVANAQEEVKKTADYVTEQDNNHSAVAEIVERFLLNSD